MTRKEKIKDFIDNYAVLIPIILAIAVIPLIVRVTFYDPLLSQYAWFAETDSVFDMFMYYKNQAMIQLDAILVVAYLYLWRKGKLQKNMQFLPLLAYTVMLVASTIASVVPDITWTGFYGMMESAYALFGYCMICYYAYCAVSTEKQLKIVLGGFLVGFLILTGIGVGQFFGLDFYNTEFGQSLVVPNQLSVGKGELNIVFPDAVVYSSLYNPNYVGVYCCILCPLLLVLAITAKNKLQMGISLALITITEICFVGAGSKTTLLLMIPFMIFIGAHYLKRYKKELIVVYIFTIAMFTIVNAYEIKGTHLVDKTISSIKKTSSTQKEILLTSIILDTDVYYVTFNDELILVKHHMDEENKLIVQVFDETGKELPVVLQKGEKENAYILESKQFKDLKFVPGVSHYGNPGVYVTHKNAKFFVYYSKSNQTYVHMNHFDRPTLLYTSESYESPIFNIMGGFSNRAYIWSKSIPILKDTLLIGSGPDTFAFMFPQYDYVGHVQHGYGNSLITKPHSMYLQIGVQTGVVSLIAFLVFNIWYLISSFKIYAGRKLESFVERCGAAIFVGTAGYLCAGLFHDSTVGTSIVYWTLMGLGFACNRILTQTTEESVKQEELAVQKEIILQEETILQEAEMI